ncbi:methyl-accepting chemotaxis protein [Pseudothauera rhizosphaerae]|uniref:Methyl-accepting chemotaxis protein n=1 Tax=Pseudothauera rhizosphaerae TaxID=2565932 RepID=A0A4S4ACX8_9RHOO|nr:methyl-accepting chemotaxis protein [Pseudothauera rhizosphaerae]THF56900.1 methyl-accepting chemotaxis protein [Pseudothauera rhizosphaerae]
MLDSLKLKTKIVLMVLAAFAGLALTVVLGALATRADLMDARKLQVQSVIQSALQVVAGYHARAAAGGLPEAEAQELAKGALEHMRFGGADGKSEYVYILATNGVTVMHPIRTDWNGRDISGEVRDSAGRYTLRDIIAVASAKGAGFADTSFPRPGSTVPVDKLQYAAAFKPWNWVIGAGVYVDDVKTAFWSRLLVDLAVSGVILLVIVGLGIVIARSVLRQIGGEPAEAMAIMERAASGDLTVNVPGAAPGSLLHGLSRMLGSIRDMVGQIANGAHTLKDTAESISHASGQVAVAAHRQADSTSSMAAAIEEMTVSINHISDSARDTEDNSSSAANLAESGEQKVATATDEMHRIAGTVSSAAEMIRSLETRTNEISSIASVIKEIAAQTNLLALNAAIEAARAGEQGRGFAVVADEVRKLAERTSAATEEIGGMISAIQSDTASAVGAMDQALPQVERGVDLAQEAAQSLRDIRDGAGATLARIRDVALATREQSAASNAIAQQVESIAQMVEETSASMQQTAESAHSLEQVARQLGELVGRFRH